jgi:hypothetical protein
MKLVDLALRVARVTARANYDVIAPIILSEIMLKARKQKDYKNAGLPG